MSIVDNFKKLDKKVQLIIISSILFIITVIIIAVIYSINATKEHSKLAKQTQGFIVQLDENSGEEIVPGQQDPELQQIPDSPALYGLANLLDRGISSENVQIVKAVLSTHYAQQNQNGVKISTVSIAKSENIKHTKDTAGYNVYIAKLVINNKQEKILQLLATSTKFIIKVGDNMDNLTTLYEN